MLSSSSIPRPGPCGTGTYPSTNGGRCEPASASGATDAGSIRQAHSPDRKAAIQCKEAARLIPVLKQCGTHLRCEVACQLRNLPRDRQASANRHVRLQYMQSAFHQIFEAPTSHFAFARGNRNRRSGAELGIASKVILRERFLQPTDIELLQQPGALQRSLNRNACPASTITSSNSRRNRRAASTCARS